MANDTLPRINSWGKCLSSSLTLDWDLVHRLASIMVVFVSVLFGTGGDIRP